MPSRLDAWIDPHVAAEVGPARRPVPPQAPARKGGRHLARTRRPLVLPALLLVSASGAFAALALAPAGGQPSKAADSEVLAVGGPSAFDEALETLTLSAARTTSPEALAAEQAQRAAAAQTPTDEQDRASRAARVDYVRPCSGVETSGFGRRWGRVHAGIDFGAPTGTPIFAVAAGVVESAGPTSGGYGNLTLLRHVDGTVTVYGHQSKILVTEGQTVAAGETIGLVGSTGHSTGPHLHFEVRPGGGAAIDPEPWLQAHGIAV